MLIIIDLSFLYHLIALDPFAIAEECKTRPAWLDLAFWILSGGLVSGLIRLGSEKIGSQALNAAYKRLKEENAEIRRRIGIIAEEKELYYDAIRTIESQIKMYSRLMNSHWDPVLGFIDVKDKDVKDKKCDSCFLLTNEITDVIRKVIPQPVDSATTGLGNTTNTTNTSTTGLGDNQITS